MLHADRRERKKRFLEHGLDGLETHRPGQPPSKLTVRLRAKILNATRRQPRDGSTHWSCRKLGKELSISKDLVHRVWREADLKPHRLERYMASNDPDFERKPPTSSVSTSIRRAMPPCFAWMRRPPFKRSTVATDVLPLSPGRAERHGFEYKRNGTLSLYAALNTKTGQVHGKTAARHTSQDFVEFLGEVVARCEPDQEIHIILDNLSAHKTKQVAAFLEQHPDVALHFTPTYSSWLNQVELWFLSCNATVIARGVFTSTADLARKLRRYINAYSKDAKPFRWKYSKPSRRIRHGKTISATVH